MAISILVSVVCLLALSKPAHAADPVEPRVVDAVRSELAQLGKKMGDAFQNIDFMRFRGFFSESTSSMERMYYLMNSPIDDMADVTIVIRPIRVKSRNDADVLLYFRMRNTAGEMQQEISTACRAKRDGGRWRLGKDIDIALAQGAYELTEVRARVSFDLPNHKMSVQAEADGRRTSSAGGSIAVSLGSCFTLDSISVDGAKVSYVKIPEHVIVDLPATAQNFTIRLAYHGEVNFTNSQVISEDETYVRMEAGWIPSIEGTRARSRVTVEAPKGQEAIVTGELITREDRVDGVVFTFDTLWPTEIPTIAMCPYPAKTRKVGDVELIAYLTPKHAAQADTYLDLAARIITFYSAHFGSYPYKRYTMMECSFMGGYGPLTFCLLSNLTFDTKELPIDFLAHEMSHVWWGGVIGTQGVESFLTEPLAMYSAYLFHEETWSAAEARDYRRWVLAQFLLTRDSAKVDAPVATATGQAGWAIRNGLNYCKGAMALHQLRRRIGRDAFVKVLTTLAADCAHKNADWPQFRAAAEAVAGEDLRAFFAQWMQSADTPDFAISEAPSYNVENRILTLALEQHEPACVFSLPVRIDTEGGVVETELQIDAVSKTFEISCANPPRSVSLDPDDEVLKVLAPSDIPLGKTSMPSGVEPTNVVYTSGVDASETDEYRSIAEKIAARVGSAEFVKVTTETDLPESELDATNVIFVGRAAGSAAFEHLFGWMPLEIGNQRIVWGGVTYGSPRQAVIISARNPRQPTSTVVLYTGNSIEALRDIADMDPGDGNFTIFSTGKPVLTGDFPRTASGHYYEFAPR